MGLGQRLAGSALGSAGLAAAVIGLSRKGRDEGVQVPDVPESPSPRRPSEARAAELGRKLERYVAVSGSPGVVAGVSRAGAQIWAEGAGLADVESGARMSERSVLRIASISKPMTVALAARLVQDGRLRWDDTVRQHLKDFPQKTWQGKKVEITVRQLAAHLGGIRHYAKTEESGSGFGNETEYYLRKDFPSVREALALFKDDPLVGEPGKVFEYTTHGYTLLSALLEKVDGRDFEAQLKDLLAQARMFDTQLDRYRAVVPNQAGYYERTGTAEGKAGALRRCPDVNNSYKWAGGGLLASVPDLLRFGVAMLGSWDASRVPLAPPSPPLLRRESVAELWRRSGPEGGTYGLGWDVGEAQGAEGARRQPEWVFHAGGAVGATSGLLLVPAEGIAVAVLVNLQEAAGVRKLCLDIAREFTKYTIAPA